MRVWINTKSLRHLEHAHRTQADLLLLLDENRIVFHTEEKLN